MLPFATGLYFWPSEEIFDLNQALALSSSSWSIISGEFDVMTAS